MAIAKAKSKHKLAKKKVAKTEKDATISKSKVKQAKAELERETNERYEYAKLILDGQSKDLKIMVEIMMEKMARMAGEPSFSVKGVKIPLGEKDRSWAIGIQEKTFYWIAARLLVALALWDIQTGDFKLPTKLCAKCGEKS